MGKTGWIGVISDTHGLLRPEASAALAGSEIILHAGDVGSPEILAQLRAIAPVFAVRGNVDHAPGCRDLPQTEVVEFGGKYFYLIHILEMLDLDPAAAGFAAVIYGHSHQPSVKWRNGVLYLNPGSAGPRRFHHPVTLAKIFPENGEMRVDIMELVKR